MAELQTVGRCGAAAPQLFSFLEPESCRLAHGHTGWHAGDRGTEWGHPLPDDDVLHVLRYVSRGRTYVDVEPYPDVEARRALGAIYEATPSEAKEDHDA